MVFPIVLFCPFGKEEHQTILKACFLLFSSLWSYSDESYISLFLGYLQIIWVILDGESQGQHCRKGIPEQNRCKRDGWKESAQHPQCNKRVLWLDHPWPFAWSPWFSCHLRTKPHSSLHRHISCFSLTDICWSVYEMWWQEKNPPPYFSGRERMRIPRSLGSLCGRTQVAEISI